MNTNQASTSTCGGMAAPAEPLEMNEFKNELEGKTQLNACKISRGWDIRLTV